MKTRKHLTRSEVDRLLEAAWQGRYPLRDRCLLMLCFVHGFRVSELCQLQLSDIDLPSRTLHIRRLKNGLSTTHPLTRQELPCLLAWLAERDSWRYADTPWLFISQIQPGLSRSQVYSIFSQYGKAARLSIDVHPHMLRHACGFALADLGADTRLIQDYLGHRNIHHTVIYTASNAKRFRGIWEREHMFAEAE